jgi:hypothetical protein
MFGPGGRWRFLVVHQFCLLLVGTATGLYLPLARLYRFRLLLLLCFCYFFILFVLFPFKPFINFLLPRWVLFGYSCPAARPMTLGVRSSLRCSQRCFDRRCLLLLSCFWFLFSISWSLSCHRLRFKFLPTPICFHSHFPPRRTDEVPLVGRGCASFFSYLGAAPAVVLYVLLLSSSLCI